MSLTSHSYDTNGLEGECVYSNKTTGCKEAIDEATPMVLQALEATSFVRKGGPFVICDYGCADGGTSMALMGDILEYLKHKYGRDLPVSIVYEDQPTNDFKSLFLRVQGLLSSSGTSLKRYSDVYISACGTGFYEQCLPSNSVHFGVCFHATHWLSKSPGPLSDCIFHLLSEIPNEQEAYKKQAAIDWEAFLVKRASELVPGGHAVIGGLGVDSTGQYTGHTDRVASSFLRDLNNLWKAMATDGKITMEEYENTSCRMYYRTKEEFTAPFRDPTSKVSKAGLQLVASELKILRCPYLEEWRESKNDGTQNAREHAERFAICSYILNAPLFLEGLSDNRSKQEKSGLVKELFNRYEDLVAGNPNDYCKDFVEVYLQVEKSTNK